MSNETVSQSASQTTTTAATVESSTPASATPATSTPIAPVETSSTRPAEGGVREASAPSKHDMVLSQQGLADVSEEELMGHSVPEVNPASSEPLVPKPNELPPATTTPSTEAKVDPKVDPKVEGEPEPVVPKGYVKLAALQEARSENRYLKEQLAAALSKGPSTQVQAPAPQKTGFEDFKELSDTEFTTLAATEPAEALLYMRKLSEFKDFQRKTAEDKSIAEQNERYLETIFNSASAEMERIVPGIFDAEAPATVEFRTFAEDIGFTEDMFYLTNPATRVILPGESEPLLLGDQAVQIIKLLATAKSKISTPATAEISADKLAELTTKIRAEVEAEVLEKIKTNQTFRSVTTIPVSAETRPEFKGRVLTTTEMALLSPADLEAYLSGE